MDDGKELEALRKRLDQLELMARAHRSITQLEAAKKAITGEYSERVKRLRRISALFQSRHETGQLVMDGLDAVKLKAEDEELINDPFAGL